MKKKESKALKNKTIKAMDAIRHIWRCNGIEDLQFSKQQIYTKNYLYKAFDNFKAFLDNIDNDN